MSTDYYRDLARRLREDRETRARALITEAADAIEELAAMVEREEGGRGVELKPCPFCGSSNVYITQNYISQFYMRCPACGGVFWAKDTDDEIDKKQVVNAWNRRASDV